MKLPKVSIVIITHNEENNIRDCLDSLQKIDYPKSLYEIIVVDSSIDRTYEIARKYKGVRVHKTNDKGFSGKRNIGIGKSKYELIAFTDADCVVPKEWLKELVKAISVNAKIGGVGGNAFAPPNSPYLGKCFACLGTPAGGALGYDVVLKKEKQGISTIVTCNALYMKKSLKEAGLFDTRLKYGGEDSDLSKRVRKKGYTLEYEPKSYVYHKTRNNLIDFIKWNVRRGYANYFVEKSSLPQLLIFLPIWPVFLIILMIILILYMQYAYAAAVLLFIWLFSLVTFFIGSKRKAKTLIKKRKKIKINIISIFVIIPLLFYLRNVSRTIGELSEMIKATRKWNSTKQ